ncbi:MAG: DUF72 domain-containing protein [Acidobacteriota bacterium]|nr:DUF72 domain-containing protein [Acidobacteriota bacterium]
MAQARGTVRSGTSGWNHADWAGVVYPRGRDVDRFAAVARFVSCLEIASTFHSWPSQASVERWSRWGHFSGLRFVALAPRALTHSRSGPDPELTARCRAVLEPLAEVGVLAAVLLQFPQGMHWERAAAERVRETIGLLGPLHCAVEFRHRSWSTERVLDWLARHGVSFCNIDQPQLPGTMPPTAWHTASPAIIRLHGRHRALWFARDGEPGRHAYRYPARELEPWAERVSELRRMAKETIVVATNHVGGHALATVLKLRALLGERGISAPPALLTLDAELADLGVVPDDDPPGG